VTAANRPGFVEAGLSPGAAHLGSDGYGLAHDVRARPREKRSAKRVPVILLRRPRPERRTESSSRGAVAGDVAASAVGGKGREQRARPHPGRAVEDRNPAGERRLTGRVRLAQREVEVRFGIAGLKLDVAV
jgi:hypothetical protein